MNFIMGNDKVGKAKAYATTKEYTQEETIKNLEGIIQDCIYRLDFAYSITVKKSNKVIALSNFKDIRKRFNKHKRKSK